MIFGIKSHILNYWKQNNQNSILKVLGFLEID